ncbi:hypothetical protein LUW75_11395 [Streptomyces sp. MRC013]|uniref:hypothetical protein n=1 Tax=Streptomyces sp. MRC013 TaxID=2898276 RepID=UPI0020272A69|nr:hypothetical protein [Streptomyces sp. MRC013]URM90506.1 hypothetical protein LUW75_11395 [Streptomyces sp. MRC013]
MNKRIARLAVAGAGPVAVLGSAPAFALSSSTAGSYAYTSTKSVSNDTANVKDTSGDSRSAYGEYYRKADPGVTKTLWNKSGAGTVVSSTGGTSIYQIRACRQEQWASDTCGPWAA